MMMTAAPDTRQSSLFMRWATLCVSLAATAAVAAVIIAITSRPEINPSTGGELAWWAKAAGLLLSWAPWGVPFFALVFAPVIVWIRSRVGRLGTLLWAIVAASAPALVLLIVASVVPGYRDLSLNAFPVAFICLVTAGVGTGVWLTTRWSPSPFNGR